MAGQSLFLRLINTPITSRLLFANRINLQPQFICLKHTANDKLKELNVPEKPKRPLSLYFKFINERRKVLTKQHPNLKVTELMKKCGDEWRELDAKVKEKYDLEYRNEMERYRQQYLEYTTKLTPAQKEAIKEAGQERKKAREKRRAKKKLRQMNKPKRPVSPFVLYAMDQAKAQNRSFVDVLSELKGQWSSLSESVRQNYTDKAADQKRIYELELIEWERKMIDEGNLDVVRQSSLPPSSSSWLKDLKSPKAAASGDTKKSKKKAVDATGDKTKSPKKEPVGTTGRKAEE